MLTTGRCLCGKLSYRASAPPVYAGFCHCPDCQRATGTGHSCYIGFACAAVEITGETKAYGVVGGSGADSYRHFCPTCGTHVFGRREPDDGTYTIYAGTLDDPESFRPENSIFVRSRRSWDVIQGNLEEFDGHP